MTPDSLGLPGPPPPASFPRWASAPVEPTRELPTPPRPSASPRPSIPRAVRPLLEPVPGRQPPPLAGLRPPPPPPQVRASGRRSPAPLALFSRGPCALPRVPRWPSGGAHCQARAASFPSSWLCGALSAVCVLGPCFTFDSHPTGLETPVDVRDFCFASAQDFLFVFKSEM